MARRDGAQLGGLRVAPTAALTARELGEVRVMLEAAFEGEFSPRDWDHTLGGVHVWVPGPGGPISHASVVDRTLVYDGQRLYVAYVEGVATRDEHRRRGHATRVMERVGELVRASYRLGALSSSQQSFYARLGWESWRGPTFVDGPAGPATHRW